MTRYSIDISIGQATVARLKDFRLYAFKVARVGVRGGMPVVWFASQAHQPPLTIAWDTNCVAYTSRTPLTAAACIELLFETAIDPGEVLTIDSLDGKGKTAAGGAPNAFAIANETATAFTSGLAQEVNGELNPICALPLWISCRYVVMPVEQVLLAFSTQQWSAGTMLTRVNAPSLLVDLRNAPGGRREVAFDFDRGWSCGGYVWGTNVAANRDLVPLLLDNSAVTYVERLIGT